MGNGDKRRDVKCHGAADDSRNTLFKFESKSYSCDKPAPSNLYDL